MERLFLGISTFSLWLLFSSFSFVAYEWKDQGMRFSLPDHFVLKKHSDAEFLAMGDYMSFHMEVYTDELISESELGPFIARMGKERYDLLQCDGQGDLFGQGYKGHFKYGLVGPRLIFVVGLLDDDLGLTYVGRIEFDNAEHADLSVAQGILKSFARK